MTGIYSHRNFYSRFVSPRTVDVWTPPDYDLPKGRRFPVMYVHDGQNLFDPDLSSSGDAWEFDKAMRLLISENRVRPAIVVGIWNTEERMRE